jgi:CRISPR-associated endoribonuclease Cas6
MLISVVLSLSSEVDVLLPPFLGRANYAATLRALGTIDSTLARVIHDSDGPKPLTCSSLLGLKAQREGVRVRAGAPVYVRITGLTPEVSRALEECLLVHPPAQWELDGHIFNVDGTTCDPAVHSWAGKTTYESLATAQILRGEPPSRRVTFDFASPVSFRSGGMSIPIPMPALVFGSLVERWNSFSPVGLSGEMRRFGEEMIAISHYRLESRDVQQDNQGMRIGGVGRVTFTALGGDRYWLGLMHVLADYALYSGVGALTAAGLGQCRKVKRRPPVSASNDSDGSNISG